MQFCFTLTCYPPQPLISSPSLFLCLLRLLLIYFWLKRKLPLRPEDFSLKMQSNVAGMNQPGAGSMYFSWGSSSPVCPILQCFPYALTPCILGLRKYSAHHRLPISPTISVLSTSLPCPQSHRNYGNSCHGLTFTFRECPQTMVWCAFTSPDAEKHWEP